MTQSGFPSWSLTASSNSNADSTVNWAEGQAPSSVNDSARAMMAALAKYRDDVSGSLTTGGTSTAFTITTNQVFASLADLDGKTITIVPHATSGASPTLAVDSLTAKGIKTATGVAVPTGGLVLGTPYDVTYFNTAGEFIVHNMVPALGATTVTSLTASGQIKSTGGATSSSTATGDVVATGGAGIGGALNVGGTATIGGNTAVGGTFSSTGALSSSSSITAGNGLVVSAGTVTLPSASVASSALASPPKFSSEYISSAIAISTPTMSFAHGFGVMPKIVEAVLVCATLNNNYAVGTEVEMINFYYGTFARVFHVSKDATNIVVTVDTNTPSSMSILDRSSGSPVSSATTNWNVKIRAWV